MASDAVVLRLPGLADDEALELRETAGPELVRLERQPIPEGAFGDLGLTAALLVLSAAALKGLAAYLYLRYRGKSFKQKIEVRAKDGTVTIVEVEWRDNTGEPIDDALMRTLSTVPGLDVKAVLAQSS